MKKISLKVPFAVFNKTDKEALAKWKHLEFAMRKPTDEEMKDYDLPQSDYRNKSNETYFKIWGAGL